MTVTRNDVADISYAVAIAHMKQGKASVTIRGVTFNTEEKGYCARFIRQIHECAMGLPAFGWEFARANARDMEAALKGHECTISPGAVVAMNGTSYWAGHIGIYLGPLPGFTGNQVAHNTSSTSWGPGTVITAYKRVEGIVTGFYSALPVRVADVDPAHPKVILLPSGKLVDCDPEVVEGVTRGNLRTVANAVATLFGGAVEFTDHIRDEGKIYIARRIP